MKVKLIQVLNFILSYIIDLVYRLYRYSKSHPKVSGIVLLVIIWHIAAYQLLGIKLPKLSKVVNAPKPIAIQTVKLNPPKPKPKPKPKEQPKKPEAPKVKEKPKEEKKKAPEKPKPKPESKPKPKPEPKKKPEKKEPPPREEISQKTRALLNDLAKTLDTISERNEETLDLPKIQTITPISDIKDNAQPQAASLEFNASDPADLWYREELIKRLKLYLKLPELDDVQVRIKIQKNGQVKEIKIVESKSKKNESYVLNTIPNIPFPRFGAQMSQYEYRIFPLILESEG